MLLQVFFVFPSVSNFISGSSVFISPALIADKVAEISARSFDFYKLPEIWQKRIARLLLEVKPEDPKTEFYFRQPGTIFQKSGIHSQRARKPRKLFHLKASNRSYINPWYLNQQL